MKNLFFHAKSITFCISACIITYFFCISPGFTVQLNESVIMITGLLRIPFVSNEKTSLLSLFCNPKEKRNLDDLI